MGITWRGAFRVLAILLRVVLALAVLAALSVKALADAHYFVPERWLLPVLVIFVGIVAFWDNVASAVRRIRAPGIRERRSSIQKAVVAALALIAHEQKLSMLDLGASVFVIRTRRWIPLPDRVKEKWTCTRPYLKRTLRYRIADHPQASNVRWWG